MFSALKALALKQKATLLITVAVEGEQLRVCVTPTKTGNKEQSSGLRPLTLVATDEELDAGFAEALAVWQAPKKSLIEQAQAASGAGEAAEDDDGDGDGDDDTPKQGSATKKATAKPAKSTKAIKQQNAKPAAAKKGAAMAPKLNPAEPWPFPGKEPGSAPDETAKQADGSGTQEGGTAAAPGCNDEGTQGSEGDTDTGNAPDADSQEPAQAAMSNGAEDAPEAKTTDFSLDLF